MAKLRIQCLVCKGETVAGKERMNDDAYQCPECGVRMSDYQWALCKAIFYIATCTEIKRNNQFEIRLFAHEYVPEDG